MEFSDFPQGSFIWSDWLCSYYIKPIQDERYHLEGMVIDLFTGEVIHYSHLKELHEVSKNSIMW